MPETENLNELRAKYQDAVVGEISRLATAVTSLTTKVDEMKYTLAQTNLTELRADVKKHDETLTRYDLKDLTDRVDKHDKHITRAVAVLVFLQILVGVVAALSKFLF